MEELQKYTDNQIIETVLDGQKNNYSEIVNRYQHKLLVYLARLLNLNQEDAKDCLSETFIKAYQNLALYNASLSFNSWIYRIAHNTAVDLIRKKSKYYSVDYETIPIAAQTKSEENPYKQNLETVLSFMKIDDRNLLTLFYLEELSLDEMSDILKTKPNTIAVKLKRAREKAKIIISTKLKKSFKN